MVRGSLFRIRIRILALFMRYRIPFYSIMLIVGLIFTVTSYQVSKTSLIFFVFACITVDCTINLVRSIRKKEFYDDVAKKAEHLLNNE